MKFNKYNYFFRYNDSEIIFNTVSGAILSLDLSSFSELKSNPTAFFELLPDESKHLLKNSSILVEDNVPFYKITEKNSNNIWEIAIYPTLSCNFKCNYCYVDSNVNKYISNETTDSIVKFITYYYNKIKPKYVHITWLGGEPLLSINIIELISERLIHNGIKFYSKVITNGYLLGINNLDILYKCKVTEIQITIDGMPYFHNSIRVLHDGSSTFDKILNNLDLSIDRYKDVSFVLRSNISKINIENVHEFYNYILNRYKSNENLFITLSFVEDFSDKSSLLQNNERISRKERIDLILDMAKSNKYKFLKSIPSSRSFHCMVNNKFSCAIDPSGYVYKCNTNIGVINYSIGNVNKIAKINFSDIPFKVLCNDIECRSCKLLPICDNMCPILRLYNRRGEKCHVIKNHVKQFIITYISNDLL